MIAPVAPSPRSGRIHRRGPIPDFRAARAQEPLHPARTCSEKTPRMPPPSRLRIRFGIGTGACPFYDADAAEGRPGPPGSGRRSRRARRRGWRGGSASAPKDRPRRPRCTAQTLTANSSQRPPYGTEASSGLMAMSTSHPTIRQATVEAARWRFEKKEADKSRLRCRGPRRFRKGSSRGFRAG